MHNFYHNDNITDLNKLRETAIRAKGLNTIHFHPYGVDCKYIEHEIYLDGEKIDERPSIKLRD